MKVATKAYGLIEVNERQRITFAAGLFGFEPLKEYILLDADRQPFYWLQSVDVKQAAFILINPFLFRPDYEIDIGDAALKEIDISSPEKALIFSIVTIPPDGGPMTANLQGPLVINRDLRLGIQAILTDPRWTTKHNIAEELAAVRETSC
ncbi:MAG: flagellar assembly protein FliW [Treponema sp.]|nr:flagellar assembly protein FliW [Treponema sp.]